MRASRLVIRNFRNYAKAEVRLAGGVTIVQGAMGAGKTNLLEALCFACTGRSPRTSSDRELVRFGERAAHVALFGWHGDSERCFEAGVELGRSKVLKADGARTGRLPDSNGRPLFCTFIPDRIELVKGPGGLRRDYLDAVVAGLWPARRAARVSYARALAQRNVLISRARGGGGFPSSLSVWNKEVARSGIEVMRDRRMAIEVLAPRFADNAREVGLAADAELRYEPRSSATEPDQLEEELMAAWTKDLARGFTTHGPHRDDLRMSVGGRDVRRFGSQGQQRLALLSLLLAERDALKEIRGDTPILLLDDVLSELDEERRRRLLLVLEGGGQTLITTADPASVPVGGLDMLRVSEGSVDG